MRSSSTGALVLATVFAATCAVALLAQQTPEGFMHKFTDPAIQYGTAPRNDAVAKLAAKLQDGSATLAFEPGDGYLRSLLKALDIPIDSQVAVFSKTSFEGPIINPKNPRTIFFNDQVAVGWVRGGTLELAAQDPKQGVALYVLPQQKVEKPGFARPGGLCLQCHVTWETFGIPGFVVESTGPPDPTGYATGGFTDDRTPFDQRWGGWYITGDPGSMHHMGNVPVETPLDKRPARPPVLSSLKGQLDLSGFISPYSDLVSLMVLEHQATMMNFVTWIGWETRVAQEADRSGLRLIGLRQEAPGAEGDIPPRIRHIARELVDYMLFVDEAPLPGPIKGSSGFTASFSAEGPHDGRGRSLRELDLQHWLFKYPCSYMIYAPAFDALPPMAKQAIYERLWEVLSGQAHDPQYARRLSLADRRAVVQILRDTKNDLPRAFAGPVQ